MTFQLPGRPFDCRSGRLQLVALEATLADPVLFGPRLCEFAHQAHLIVRRFGNCVCLTGCGASLAYRTSARGPCGIPPGEPLPSTNSDADMVRVDPAECATTDLLGRHDR